VFSIFDVQSKFRDGGLSLGSSPRIDATEWIQLHNDSIRKHLEPYRSTVAPTWRVRLLQRQHWCIALRRGYSERNQSDLRLERSHKLKPVVPAVSIVMVVFFGLLAAIYRAGEDPLLFLAIVVLIGLGLIAVGFFAPLKRDHRSIPQ
jgi:hypothetical protein